jgi:hypothetical protein
MFLYMNIQRLAAVETPRLGFMSPRKWLIVNNFVMSICAIALFAFSMLVCVTFYQNSAQNTRASDRFSSLYNWLVLGFVGLALTIFCIIAMRGAHLVS